MRFFMFASEIEIIERNHTVLAFLDLEEYSTIHGPSPSHSARLAAVEMEPHVQPLASSPHLVNDE